MKKIFIILALVLMPYIFINAQGIHLDPDAVDPEGSENRASDYLISPDNSEKAEGNVKKFVLRTANNILFFASGIAIISLIIGSLKLVKGMGNEEAIAKAKTNILWSVIGLFVIILSYSIVRTIIEVVFSTSSG